MDIQTAKQIRIADFLYSLGHSPVKQQGINLWYKSPLREETEPSFKINTERNQWYDFAIGKGGNIIALAQELYYSDYVPYLLQKIEEQTPHIRPVSFSFGKQSFSEPSFQELDIVQLTSPALLAYLQERGINTALAKRECKEARFTHNGKRYFAIAFPNISGGYEIRNRYFKGCIAPKEISHIRQSGKPRSACYVFEGFMDYLSFLTLRLESSKARDILVERNLRLVAHVVKKYQGLPDDLDDLISIGTIGLIKAVMTYDSKKGNRLAAYAARCIDNELLMYLRSKKKTAREISLYEPIGTDKEGNEIHLLDIVEGGGEDIAEQYNRKEDAVRLYCYLDSELKEQEKQVLLLRYGLGGKAEYTQKQVAARLGISRSYVSRIEKNAIEKLRLRFAAS